MAVHEDPIGTTGGSTSVLEAPSLELSGTLVEAHSVSENVAHLGQNEATMKDVAGRHVPDEDKVNEDTQENKNQIEIPKELKGGITLKHYDGDDFLFPLALCQTWEDMKEKILLSFGENEEWKEEFLEGNFTLRKSRYSGQGAAISVDHWHMLAEPSLEVTVKLNSQKLRPDDSDQEISDSENEESDTDDQDDVAPKYSEEVRYTVDYIKKAKYSYEDDQLLWTVCFEKPLSLQQSTGKAKEMPVLEERMTVTGSAHAKGLKEPAPNQVPKLLATDSVSKPILQIYSPFLLNALRAVIRYTSSPPSGDKQDDLTTGVFQYPYQDLFYHKNRLLAYKKEQNGSRSRHDKEYNDICDRHIDILVDYLNNHPEVELLATEQNWAKRVPVTTFASLWLLLQPGEDVYVEEDGQLNAYVVHSVSGGTIQSGSNAGRALVSATEYMINAWKIVYDGERIRRMRKLIILPVFNGERAIKSLPVFPTRFQDEVDGGVRRTELIERGRKMFDYSRKPTFLEYTGLGKKEGFKQHRRSRVVVDHKSQPWLAPAFQSLYSWDLSEEDDEPNDRSRAARCECHRCAEFEVNHEVYTLPTFKEYDDIDPSAPGEITDHHYLLCMSHMYGFILKDRVYDLLDVSGLSSPILANNAIENLVMRPESSKDTIKAIVQTYGGGNGQSEQFHADFIHGKGEGQIFLLHGPPGTGKTLTAESVAEYTKRPLLSITAADLGHEPVDLERNLLGFFKDATNWNAIVLLDEADVYLERRSSEDLRRNSIVSIFLRALEYFEGILFLTTNRVGHFDEAFLSRIHVSIGYETLDDEARGYIWENLLAKLKDESRNGGRKIHCDYDVKQYIKKDRDLKELKWNGREIRNAFQTAVALAIYDADKANRNSQSDEKAIPELKEKHLIQVVNMSIAFKQYITSTHNDINDSDYAFKIGNRNDAFKFRSRGSDN